MGILILGLNEAVLKYSPKNKQKNSERHFSNFVIFRTDEVPESLR
jgi:hypothetical protein